MSEFWGRLHGTVPSKLSRGEMLDRLNDSLDYARQTGDSIGIGVAHFYRGVWFETDSLNFPAAMDSAALSFVRSTQYVAPHYDPVQATKMYDDRAIYCRSVQRPYLGEAVAIQCLEVAAANELPAAAAGCRATLALLYMELNDTARTVRTARENLDYFADSTTDTLPGLTYQRTAQALVRVGAYRASLPASEYAIRAFEREEDSQSFNKLPSAYENKGEAYLGLGQLDSALQNFQRAYAIVRSDQGEERAREFTLGLARTYYRMGELRRAAAYFQDAMKFAREFEYGSDPADLGAYATTLLSIGNYEAASSILTEQIAAQHRVYRQEVNRLRGELSEKYESQLKNETIRKQETVIGVQRRNQALTTALAAILVVGVFGLLFGLRNNRRKNALLTRQNDRNELLIKEIHHRVKNNLETVSSLLELQSATLSDGRALAAVQAGQSRVESMGLLHQRLYLGENLAAIEMKDYFTQLAVGLSETYAVDERIRIDVAMAPLELDVDSAIPLGLIVNELLTNSIKYAFPGGDAGAVRVELKQTGETRYQLIVADNGVGKDLAAGPGGTGFGSRLVGLLVRQLGGEFREGHVSDGGWRTEVIF